MRALRMYGIEELICEKFTLMGFWNRYFTDRRASKIFPVGKPGARAYAIGDVHGRLDLLDQVLADISDDLAENPIAEAFVIFLGDFIDRGPASCGVIQRLVDLDLPGARSIFLGGNHEQVLLDILDGVPGVLHDWLQYGGAECVESYGIEVARLARMNDADGSNLIRSKMPDSHIAFLRNLGDTFRFGDYLYVHAGIMPGVPVEQQTRRDLRWIRGPFLRSEDDHGFVVVHGHTIMSHVDERGNRIGIDTGAYRSGVLTALVVDGANRRYISTGKTATPALAVARVAEDC